MRKLIVARIKKLQLRITSSPRFPRALLLVGLVYVAFGVFAGANAISLLVTHHSIDEAITGVYWYLCSDSLTNRWQFQAAMSGGFSVYSLVCGAWLLKQWRKRRAKANGREADRPQPSDPGK